MSRLMVISVITLYLGIWNLGAQPIPIEKVRDHFLPWINQMMLL